MSTSSDLTFRRQIKSRLLALPPRAFELFAGDLLEFIGLRNVLVTRYTSDGGIDAIGTLETKNAAINIPTGVQVKRYRANVQRADIDRFIGALSGQYSHGIFITTAGYSKQATLKAVAGFPRVATIDGDQVVALMLQHHLGVAQADTTVEAIDEEYFGQFETLAAARSRRIEDQPEIYQVQAGEIGRVVLPEDDLISLRALSHALRVDSSVLRRWIEKGLLQPDQAQADVRSGCYFRRGRIEAIRSQLLGRARPTDSEAWRQEFLEFASSHNLSKSYKPVMLKALLKLVNRNGEVPIDELTEAFRAFYLERQRAGLPVEFGPPDLTDGEAVSDIQLRQLIIKNPLERFLIKGFLEYTAEEGIMRFAPELWSELRAYDLLDLNQSADEQLAYYYSRRGSLDS
jgi:hypothetical protein